MTESQLQKLEEYYLKEKYPSGKEIVKISAILDVADTKVENWFKHRRKHDVKTGKMSFMVIYYKNVNFSNSPAHSVRKPS